MFHGAAAAQAAQEEFVRIFQQRQLPTDMPTVALSAPTPLVDLMVSAGLAASKSEARRLIAQGGVEIGGAEGQRRPGRGAGAGRAGGPGGQAAVRSGGGGVGTGNGGRSTDGTDAERGVTDPQITQIPQIRGRGDGGENHKDGQGAQWRGEIPHQPRNTRTTRNRRRRGSPFPQARRLAGSSFQPESRGRGRPVAKPKTPPSAAWEGALCASRTNADKNSHDRH